MTGSKLQLAYVGAAILFVVILAQAAPKYAGYLLLMLTLGMLYAGRAMLTA